MVVGGWASGLVFLCRVGGCIRLVLDTFAACQMKVGLLPCRKWQKKRTLSKTAKDRKSFSETVARLLCSLAHTLTRPHPHATHTHIRTHHRIHVKACTCKFNERQWLKLRPRPLSVVFCGMKHTHTCAGIYSYMSTSSFIAMQSVVAFISGSQIAKA